MIYRITKDEFGTSAPLAQSHLLPAVPFTHLGLFEGIGGFSLAAKWMGWETLAWCEWNEFGQRILKHHFPNAEGFGDIKKTDFTKYANTIDILTGGFPCQPYSVAGKRKGKEDERHLWPEMLRVIGEVQPTYVVGENVSGLISWDGGLVFHEVQTDLEAKGYEVQPFVLPACAKNAPHRRDRVWFVAYSNSCRNNRTERSKNGIWEQQNKEQSRDRGAMQTNGLSNERIIANTECNGVQQNETGTLCNGNRNDKEQTFIGQKFTSGFGTTDKPLDWTSWPTKPPILGGDDGLPTELDGITFSKWRNESIKAYGNAIVPQVAYEIFKAVEGVHWHSR
jgi:DNA (cytosine-5)-methyltransferase 1